MNRVLIIDDQPVFRRKLHTLLKFAGMVVVGEAADIPTALQIAENTRPDIAVVDVMLNGEYGFDGARQLKDLIKHLRVYLVSAHHDRAGLFMKSAREIGAEAFIPKDELNLGVIKSWMEK